MVGEQLIEPSKAMSEPPREHPSLPVSMALIEARDMVDDAQSPHFRAHGFEGAMAGAVFVRYPLQCRQELILGPLQFHEDAQECTLLILVAWEKKLR